MHASEVIIRTKNLAIRTAMSKYKKIAGLLIKGFLIIFTLIIIVMVIAPKLINLEMVRKKIKNTVSVEIGGEIKYRRMEVSYFPNPHIVIHEVEILIPDSFTINIHRMKVYPKIFPLFTGSLRVGLRIQWQGHRTRGLGESFLWGVAVGLRGC